MANVRKIRVANMMRWRGGGRLDGCGEVAARATMVDVARRDEKI